MPKLLSFGMKKSKSYFSGEMLSKFCFELCEICLIRAMLHSLSIITSRII